MRMRMRAHVPREVVLAAAQRAARSQSPARGVRGARACTCHVGARENRQLCRFDMNIAATKLRFREPTDNGVVTFTRSGEKELNKKKDVGSEDPQTLPW